MEGDKGVLPVLWGENYFHVVPLYWHWDNNYLLFPVGWKIGDDKGVGPVWWGKNYFDVFPLYWQWNDKKLILPFVYEQAGEDQYDFRFLWRVIHYHRDANGRLFELQPLMTSERTETCRRFSVLGIGWEKTPAGRALTFLWWKIPLGDASPNRP